jgi:Tfp pilus assembly protein PilV
MPGHGADQPLISERGFSLVEALITLVLVVMLIGVLLALISAGIKSNLYATRQMTVLLNARQALDSGNSMPGMARQARSSLTSAGLSGTQLTLNIPGGSTSQYNLSGDTLTLSRLGQTFTLAKNITVLQVGYYNLDASGFIMVSTQAAAASLMTVWIQSKQNGGKTYTFYSGGRLRNHL